VNSFAVANTLMNSTVLLRPPRPANDLVNSMGVVPGAPFCRCSHD